jgi:type 1 glutamine amidotransferase
LSADSCLGSFPAKQNEPMDWIARYGKGRIYTTMQGHTWKGEANPNLEYVAFQTLLARGVEWAASSRVTIPAPAGLPTAQKISLRALK